MTTKPKENNIFFLYARKSSESEDRQVQSIEDQVNRLTELAGALSIEIKEILTESKSAKKPNNRPVFSDMIHRLEKGEAQGILCWQINRLSRNPIDSGTISWMLQQGKLQCIQTIDRKYLPDDNVLLFNVESGMANQYIIDLRKNCRRGMVGKAERGWMPACVTIGYINNKEDHLIIPDKKRFHLVRQMWDMMLSGNYTPQQIRKIANDTWGFRTQQKKKMGGKGLSNAVMYRMFGNIFYTGLFQWSGKLYQGNHTPMITLDEYDRVQMLLGRKGSSRSQHHQFAYTGIIRCSVCGSMFTASEKRKLVKTTGEYKTYVYYHCTRKKKEIGCKNMPITVSDLELQLEMELERYTIAPEFLTWAVEILNSKKEQDNTDTAKIHAMREQSLAESQKELDTLTRMRYRDLIDDEQFVKERDVLKDKITKLKAQLLETVNYDVRWIELTEKAFYFAAYARQDFVNGTKEARREIFSTFGSNYAANDKKLIFEASVWLLPIAKAYPALYAEYRRLELEKYLTIEARKAALDNIIQRWSAIVEDVRTAISDKNDPNLYIPDLKPPH